MPQTFRKEERLCSHKLIQKLFEEGEAVLKYPFRVVYLTGSLPTEMPVQVIMSVSKKRFKRANKRNLLRRRMKEAYRLNKDAFYNELTKLGIQVAMSVNYLPTDELSYAEIEKGMKKLLMRLMDQLTQNHENSKE
jgi:ribonuclease P protein component